MNNNQLNRALKLVKKNGDKFLIMDKDSNEVFALMDLDSYEDLLMDFDDFEPEFGPSDNPFYGMPDDLEDWHEEPTELNEDFSSIKESEGDGEENDKKNLFAIPEERFGASENNEDTTHPSPEASGDTIHPSPEASGDTIKTVPIKNNSDWQSVGNIISEEALDDLPEDDLDEDDKFYLEPVE